MRFDAFVGPGHVSTVTGCRPYEFIARDYGKPVVISGFEPLDILESILMILRQLGVGEARVENQYRRIVPWEGNLPALRAIGEAFELRPYFEWRGLGFISQSALKVSSAFAAWDAEVQFEVPGIRVTDPKAAQCGEVLKGVLKPPQCKLFGKECNPEHPVGALMVSSEGACAAYYRYAHLSEPVPASAMETVERVAPRVRFHDPQIEMAHGAGGKASRRLVEGLFVPLLANPIFETLSDSALSDFKGSRIATTADGYVVKPLRFPGGSIGELAINGTVNDLAVSGAPRPLALMASLYSGGRIAGNDAARRGRGDGGGRSAGRR